MSNHIQERAHQNSDQDRSMRSLKPGQSMQPPELQLKASPDFLNGSIGEGGENLPEDLRKLGQFLYDNRAPLVLVADVVNPAKNVQVIKRYQREVLGFKSPDGRIDPGGKTITAIRELRGRDIVAGWYAQNFKDGKEGEAESEGATGKGFQAKPGEIAPVLSKSQYFSQYNQGAPCVPLSLLKANLSKKSSEKGYRNVGCYQTCRYTLMQAGFTPGSKADAEYLLKIKTNGKKGESGFSKSIGGLTDNFASSLSELDQSLMKGVPVIVGVNKNTRNHKWTNTKTDGNVSPTDHFVVIIGKTVTSDGQVAYRFFDPARYSVANGTSSKNLLVQEKGGQFTGNPYKNHNYSLSEIRA